MRRPRPSTLGIVLLALVAGFGLLVAWIGAYGPPPRLVRVLMSTSLGDRLAQGMLRAGAPAPPPGVTVLGPGDRLPDWVLSDVDGHPRSLAQWQGRRRVIVFWATWCAPCLQEMPRLAAAQHAQGKGGAQIIGIAMDDPPAVRAFLHAHPQDYPILLGDRLHPDPRVTLGNTRRALPFSVLVGADGRIERTRLGGLDAATLDRWMH